MDRFPQVRHVGIERLEQRVLFAHAAVHTVVFPEKAGSGDGSVRGATPVIEVNHRVKFDNATGIIAILIG
jgi:hypothetical protein